jgi:hypothetical protein
MDLRMTKKQWCKIIIWILLLIIIILLGCSDDRYFINEKYIITEKGPDLGNQYFLIRTIPHSNVLVQYDTINNIKNTVIIAKNADTLYTLLTPMNYMYQKNMEWAQMSYSYNVGDTLLLESLEKNRFWKKVNNGLEINN